MLVLDFQNRTNSGCPKSKYDFVLYLVEREKEEKELHFSEAFQTMLASEDVLRRDWDLPEEDEAWADL